jgi:hypothetical protein
MVSKDPMHIDNVRARRAADSAEQDMYRQIAREIDGPPQPGIVTLVKRALAAGSPRYSVTDNSPEAAAERHVPRNPRPLCQDFVPQSPPAEFWCATCRWNQPMHADERHRSAIAAELRRLGVEED